MSDSSEAGEAECAAQAPYWLLPEIDLEVGTYADGKTAELRLEKPVAMNRHTNARTHAHCVYITHTGGRN